MRHVLFAALAVLFCFTFTACGPECSPEPDLVVTMDQDIEEVRALPILASGKTELLAVQVPDSHGDFTVNLRITNAPYVIVDDFRVDQLIAGQPQDIELIRFRHNDEDLEKTDQAFNQSKLRFNWRMKQLADYALTEGQQYTSKVTLNWRYAGCRTQTGVATADVVGTVKSTNTLKNFVLQAQDAGRIDVLRGPKAKLTLGSNISNDRVQNITAPKYTVVFFDEGLPPTLGLGLAGADNIALQVNGQPRRYIDAADTIEVYTSSNPSVGGAPYDHAGQGASTATLVGGGKALVKLEIESERANGTSPEADVIWTLADVQ